MHPAAGGQQGYPPASQNQGYPVAPHQGYPGAVSDKTKLVAGLLALFLGGLGIHHFYNDNPMMGIGRIAVTVLCFVPFIGIIFLLIDFVWWVADVVMAFTGNGPFKQDKYGRPLQ
ncbi:NINE protein [Corynebacterium massiliense]|uniref:NINE protein n=1 Tax=Corynebacterium massiliense TaxID=441501 RepID=UPI00235630E4|nr:NINE protein [Corynebacterium massiliense]